MIRKILTAILALSLTAGVATAQKKARMAPAKNQSATIDEPDAGNGQMDVHRFYQTPYRSRNNGTYGLDRRLLSFGLGFPNTLPYDYNYHSGGRSGFGPVMAKYEMAVRDEVGIGAVVDAAYSQFRYTAASREYRDKAFGLGVSFLGYYHFNKLIPVHKLDVYGGVGINISHVAVTNDLADYKDGYIDVLPALVAGARYYFRPTFAPYLEFGRTNYSYANIGISLNL